MALPKKQKDHQARPLSEAKEIKKTKKKGTKCPKPQRKAPKRTPVTAYSLGADGRGGKSAIATHFLSSEEEAMVKTTMATMSTKMFLMKATRDTLSISGGS